MIINSPRLQTLHPLKTQPKKEFQYQTPIKPEKNIAFGSSGSSESLIVALAGLLLPVLVTVGAVSAERYYRAPTSGSLAQETKQEILQNDQGDSLVIMQEDGNGNKQAKINPAVLEKLDQILSKVAATPTQTKFPEGTQLYQTSNPQELTYTMFARRGIDVNPGDTATDFANQAFKLCNNEARQQDLRVNKGVRADSIIPVIDYNINNQDARTVEIPVSCLFMEPHALDDDGKVRENEAHPVNVNEHLMETFNSTVQQAARNRLHNDYKQLPQGTTLQDILREEINNRVVVADGENTLLRDAKLVDKDNSWNIFKEYELKNERLTTYADVASGIIQEYGLVPYRLLNSEDEGRVFNWRGDMNEFPPRTTVGSMHDQITDRALNQMHGTGMRQHESDIANANVIVLPVNLVELEKSGRRHDSAEVEVAFMAFTTPEIAEEYYKLNQEKLTDSLERLTQHNAVFIAPRWDG